MAAAATAVAATATVAATVASAATAAATSPIGPSAAARFPEPLLAKVLPAPNGGYHPAAHEAGEADQECGQVNGPGAHDATIRVMQLRRRVNLARVNRIATQFELPDAAWKTCSWQPRELVETGLRQWLRCAGAALRDGQVIGMPSNAVDELWHGLILCTADYAEFCQAAYGQFLHHHPDGSGAPSAGPMMEQLRRTIVAWQFVAGPGETCVLWDLDQQVGLDSPWGVTQNQVQAVITDLRLSGPVSQGSSRRRPRNYNDSI